MALLLKDDSREQDVLVSLCPSGPNTFKLRVEKEGGHIGQNLLEINLDVNGKVQINLIQLDKEVCDRVPIRVAQNTGLAFVWHNLRNSRGDAV